MRGQDCEHVWALTEVVLGTGADLVEQCSACGATAFTPSQQDQRLPLPPPHPDCGP